MARRSSFAAQMLVGSLLLSLLVSCASIVGKSSPETLNVRSTPDQARVVIDDETGNKVFEGKTPTILTLEKKRGYFSGKKYNVTISKEGFKDQSVVVDTQLGMWYVGGNLIFGGLIGWLIVDPATGAMWTLSTNEINASLESLPTPSAQQTSPQVPVAAAPAPQASPAPAQPAPQTSPAPAQPGPQAVPAPQAPVPQTAPPSQTRLTAPKAAVIVMLQDVPESLRSKMVPVSQ